MRDSLKGITLPDRAFLGAFHIIFREIHAHKITMYYRNYKFYFSYGWVVNVFYGRQECKRCGIMGYCHMIIYGTFVGITLFTATEAWRQDTALLHSLRLL